MDCNKIQNVMMSLYIDNKLSKKEKSDFEKHIQNCTECSEELEIMKKMLDDVSSLDCDKELPSNYHQNLMSKIEELPKKEQRKNKKTGYKLYSRVAAAFVIVVIFGIIGISNLNLLNNVSQEKSSAPEMAALPERNHIQLDSNKDMGITNIESSESIEESTNGSQYSIMQENTEELIEEDKTLDPNVGIEEKTIASKNTRAKVNNELDNASSQETVNNENIQKEDEKKNYNYIFVIGLFIILSGIAILFNKKIYNSFKNF